MADGDEDFSSLPLAERIVHKSWKARQGAYEELTKTFKTLDPDADAEYRKYQEYLKKMVTDSNVAAQETGLNAMLAYVENAPSGGKTRNVIVPLLVDKALGSTRASNKTKAVEIILMYIEVENKADGVIEDILPGLDHKTPKNVVACITVMREAIRLFGTKVVGVKPILKHLPKIFDHKDKTIRNEGTALAVEMYRWLGAALMPSIGELKPVQLKELNDLFQSLPEERAKAERLIRSEQAKREAPGFVPEEEPGQPVQEAEPEPVDPFDLADPVNVLDKMPPKFYEELASDFLLLVKFPKLEDGRYGELLNVLAKVNGHDGIQKANFQKRVNDANILVGTGAINCIEHIAREVLIDAKVLSSLLEKLKEKKAAVIEAIRNALDAVFLSCSFAEVMEDVVGSAAHKNPQVRMETVQWMIRCLKSTRKPPGKSEVKALAETFLKTLDDSDATTRDAGAEGFGTLMKVVTERPLASFMEKLDKTKEPKVREYFEKAEVRVGGSAPAKRPATASSAAAPSSHNKENNPPAFEISKPRTAPSSKSSAKPSAPPTRKPTSSPSSAKPSAPSAKAEAPKKKTAAAVVEEIISFKYSDDSAEAWMQEMFSGSINLADLTDANWKTRLAAIQALLETIKAGDLGSIQAEAVIRHLLKAPGWKESNFQVMTGVVNIMIATSKAPSFSKSVASLAIPGLCEKIGDMKVKKVSSECLTAFSETASFQFVLSQMYEPLKKAKSPKTIGDGVMWIYQSLMEFGIAGLVVRDMVDFAKVTIGNTNVAVRNNTVTLLGGLRQFVGPDIRALLGDLSSQVMATIDTEFEKVAAREPPKPSKVQAVADAVGSADPAEDLFPRVDLAAIVPQDIVDNLSDANWKTRKEAMDALAKILETNKRIKHNLGEIGTALKGRLTDSNKNLCMQAVEIFGVLAVAMGKAFERHTKTVFSPMAGLLADQKAHIRAAAITALDNVFAACGLEPCLSSIANSLMVEQPQLRKDLLKWFTEKIDITKEQGLNLVEVQPLVHPILMCLQDRNADVRKPASVVLNMLAESVGMSTITEKAGELFKGAALQSLSPYFEAAKANSKSAATASSSLKAPSAVTPSKLKRASAIVSSSSDMAGSKLKLPGASAAGLKGAKPRPNSIAGTLSLKREVPAVSPSTDASRPFLTMELGDKENRAAQDRGLTKWTFDVPRRELIEFLQEQCEGNIFPGIVSLMFSTDHYKEKDYLSALTLIDEGIMNAMSQGNDELIASCVCNSDLVLKYITIRLFDTNTSSLIKCLEVVEHLLQLLDSQNIMLSEYEAAAFLPFFVNKAGDNKETMRAKIRAIFKQICRVYPASKMFGYLLDALKSKNSRTRTECLEELADIVKKNGMAVCAPSRVFPTIAAQISDSDAKVRNAALSVITQAYLLVGDAVYKYVGRLADKDKSLIEEKLKRLPAPSLAPPPSRIPPTSIDSLRQQASAASNRSSVQSLEEMMPSSLSKLKERTQSAGLVGIPGRPMSMYTNPKADSAESVAYPVKKEFSLDLDKLNQGSTISRPVAGNPLGLSSGLTGSFENVNGGYNGASSAGDTSMMDMIVTQIMASDAYQSIDALKQLEKALTSAVPTVLPHLDEILSAITLQIRIAFTAADVASPGTGRLCKHLVNVLVQIFSVPELAREAGIEVMQQCVQELLKRLLDPGLQGVEQGGQLARALNVLMSTMETLKAAPKDAPTHAKYTELVMKCLWKLTKVIPQLFEQNLLDVGKLILAIHEFLEVSPPSDWKRRAAEKSIPQADMPLRTVKTILHEIVAVFGESAVDFGSVVGDTERSHAVTYLRQLVEQAKKKAGGSLGGSKEVSNASSRASPIELSKPVSTPSAPSLSLSSTATATHTNSKPEDLPLPTPSLNPRPTSPPLDDQEAEKRLTVIFHRMSQKDETKKGIAELHTFRKDHPEAEDRVRVFYEKTSPYFRSYIRRALVTLEESSGGLSNGGGSGYGGETTVKRASTLGVSSLSGVAGSNGGLGSASGFGLGSSTVASSTTSAFRGSYSGDDGSSSYKLNSVESYQKSLLKYQQMLAKKPDEDLGFGTSAASPARNGSLSSASSNLDSLAWRGSGLGNGGSGDLGSPVGARMEVPASISYLTSRKDGGGETAMARPLGSFGFSGTSFGREELVAPPGVVRAEQKPADTLSSIAELKERVRRSKVQFIYG
ncbi:Microtubule-associated protein, microtubule dynamics during spindle orientation [Phlyctochytrium planicorne]|nr:Microtubule-associated protein, microtubule dynamics during spindle orientation [Phlyctochytrium planicorne]